MIAWIRRLLMIAMLMSLLPGQPAVAEGRRLREPLMVRMHGYIGSPRELPKPDATLQLLYDEREIALNVTKLRIITGNTSPSRVLSELQAYRYRLRMSGPPPVIDHLQHAVASDEVEVIGYLRIAERLLMVSEINVSKPTPAVDPAPVPGEK